MAAVASAFGGGSWSRVRSKHQIIAEEIFGNGELRLSSWGDFQAGEPRRAESVMKLSTKRDMS